MKLQLTGNDLGAAQSIAGSLTGNQSASEKGADKRTEAAAKDDLSHTTAKVGPFSATPDGGFATDDQRRSEGSWNQTVGSAKESIGGLVGAQGLKQEGIKQNQQGKEQEAAGQLSDLGSGAGDRLKGAAGAGLHGVTGNKEEQARYQALHDDGKAQQRGAEHDIQKQNP